MACATAATSFYSDPKCFGEGGEGFYAAYFRDLDGNKLDVFHYG